MQARELNLDTSVPSGVRLRASIASTVAQTGRLFISHEANKTWGIGSEVPPLIAERGPLAGTRGPISPVAVLAL
jgi:pyruvate/2-oxoglutarate/acetoin dehydrogenase E1 component